MSSTLNDLVKEIQFKTKWTLDDVAMAIGSTRYFLRRAIKNNDVEGEIYNQLIALKDFNPPASQAKKEEPMPIAEPGDPTDLKDELIQQLREKNAQCSEEKAFLRQVVLNNQESIKARLTEIENSQQKMFSLLENDSSTDAHKSDDDQAQS